MQTLLTLVCIQFLVVFVLDYSGAVDELITPIVRRITGSRTGELGKPWNCSLCMTFWTGLIYLICAGTISIGWVAMVAWLAILTPVTLEMIWLVRATFDAIFRWYKGENNVE